MKTSMKFKWKLMFTVLVSGRDRYIYKGSHEQYRWNLVGRSLPQVFAVVLKHVFLCVQEDRDWCIICSFIDSTNVSASKYHISGNIHAVDGHALFGGNWKHLRTMFGVLHCHEQSTKIANNLIAIHFVVFTWSQFAGTSWMAGWFWCIKINH